MQRILTVLQPPPFFRREKGGGCLFTGGHGGAAVSLQAATAGRLSARTKIFPRKGAAAGCFLFPQKIQNIPEKSIQNDRKCAIIVAELLRGAARALRENSRHMQLNEARVGQTYTVKRIDLPFEMQRRLEALGMTDEAPVSVLNRKGKGILIIKLRGTRFALGYNITKNIEVTAHE